MIIKSKKLVLRHLVKSDAKDYFLAHDRDAAKNFCSVPRSLSEAKKELTEKIGQYKMATPKRFEEAFVIEVDGNFAGWISIHDIIYGHKAVSASLVSKDYRGKGIGTEAHKLILKYAFKKYKLRRLIGRVRTFNKPSARMLEKAGYKLEGVMKKDFFRKGKYYDTYLYAIVK